MHVSGRQEGRDMADLVECIAEQSWSNKRYVYSKLSSKYNVLTDAVHSVSMAGNSWLTQVQWFTATEKPPHLTCIAPSEGWSDFYRDICVRGGVPNGGFWDWLIKQGTHGRGRIEDVIKMSKEHTFWHEYWEQRRAELENIEVSLDT